MNDSLSLEYLNCYIPSNSQILTSMQRVEFILLQSLHYKNSLLFLACA